MRKFCTFLLTMVVAIVANAAINPTVQLGDEFKSVKDLEGKVFVIANLDDQKALYGPNNQNLEYGAFDKAFQNTNSGYLWQIESLAENDDASVHDYFLIRLVRPDGTVFPTSDWEGRYLNSQDDKGWCCFNLGLTAKKLGQDIDYGAVWDIQYVEGKGFTLKNIGTGLYKGANTGTANVAEENAPGFAFCPVTTTYVPALKALLAEGEAMKANGASSTEYDEAIAGIDPETTTDALADAQKVEAALPLLVKSQSKAGSDFTRAIANFECGAKDGWTFDKPLGGNGPDYANGFEYWAGNASNRAEASFDYYQEITGLPNGTYTVGADMYNSLNNEGGAYTEFKPTCGVYATVGETTVSKLVDVNSETQVPYVTDAIEVTDGTIRIGVKSFETPMAARWFTVKNFKLTLVEPAAAPVPAEDAWFTDNTFCIKDAANGISRSMDLPWAVDPDDASNGCIKLSSAANAGNDHDLQFMIRGAEYDGSNLMNGAFAEGTGFKVTFKVKADGNYSGCLVGTFNSIVAEGKDGWKFGKYLENQAVKMDVTTEWQTVSYSYFATADDAGKFTAIGFNLAEKGGAARTFYFDDVQIEQGSEWSLATTITDKWKENGQDKNKPATFKTENGESFVEIVTTSNANTWDNQVFFQIADASPSGKLKKNDKITLQFQAMATLDAESTLTNTEIQAGGGFHKSYDGAGWLASTDGATIKVGDWAEVTREITINRDDITNFSLDLSYDSKPITYRFKDVKVTYESGVESWTETMAYRLKVTPFTWDADAEKWNKEADTNEAPTYDLGTGGEEGGYYQVEAAPKHDNTYETQFFFQIADLAPTKVLKNNETVTLKFKIKPISENLEAGTEIQCGGGFHKSYDGAGWLSGAPSSTCVVGQWTTVEQTFEIGNADITCYSIDLSQDTEAPITYQIDEVEGTWTEAPVLDWVELIAGGDCEATPEHVFVVAKESPIDAEEVHQGRIVEGVGVDGSYGIEIVAGDKVSQPWDNQFWIYEPYSLPSGTKFTVEFDYRAKEAATASSQIHLAPSAYQYWNAVGNVNFTTEWKHFKYEGKVSNGDNNAIINLRALAFNISEKAEANTYYIDNVSFKVPAGTIDGIEPVYVDDYPTATYTDPSTLTYTDNILVNGDLEGEDMNEFVGKIVKGDYIYDGDGFPTDEYVYEDLDPETLTLEAEEYVESWEQEQAGEAGPNGLVISVAEWPEGQGNDYDSQLWVRLPKALPKGTAFKLSFDYAGSNSATSVAMAAHAEPGQWQNNFSKTIKPADDWAWTHFEEYMTAPEDMRSIAFNLGSKNGGVYYFDNFSVQYDAAKATDVEELTATWDMNWAETLALNEKIHEAKGYDNEEGQYTEESFSALQTAITDAKTVAKNAEAAKDDIVAATSDVQDAIDGLKAPEVFVALPELSDEYEAIPLSQEDYGSFSKTAVSSGEYNGDAYTVYTASGQIQGAFKMKNVDVTGCDKIYIYFAQPVKQGWEKAFWGIEGPDGVKSVDAGTTCIEFDLTEDLNGTGATYEDNGKTILKEVTLMTLWGASEFPLEAKVYGAWKHKVAPELSYTDLTQGMFFQWSDWTDGDPIANAGCAYDVNVESGQPYGDSNVINYADLSEYATLEVTTPAGTAVQPRFLFNRDVNEGQDNEVEENAHLIDMPKFAWSEKYQSVKENVDGSKTYIIDIAAIVADKGYAHLHAIKALGWGNSTTVTDMKLGYYGEKPSIPIPTAINAVAEGGEGAALKDGKYFVDGQTIIVKNGKKYTVAGVEIK